MDQTSRVLKISLRSSGAIGSGIIDVQNRRYHKRFLLPSTGTAHGIQLFSRAATAKDLCRCQNLIENRCVSFSAHRDAHFLVPQK